MSAAAAILGVIPARGGSKGIPRKNLQVLSGKPLMQWTVEAAKDARLLSRLVVSTEDEEIAAFSRSCGVEVLKRPAELASDEATTLSVLQHAVTRLPADVVVLLQATSPVRDPGLIDRCIRQFLAARADSLATGFVCKAAPYGTETRRRQEIEGVFCDDGNVYVMKADLIRRGDRYGSRIERVILDREQNVDVDDAFDLWVAEKILERRMAHAGCGAVAALRAPAC